MATGVSAAVLLAIGALPAPSAWATAPAPASVAAEPADPPADDSPETAASRQAQATGQPVEVEAKRTEDETILANPDGTFTSETTAEPQRVKRADGSWVGTDPTLIVRPDGSIGPRAAVVDLTLSKGDDNHLVRLADGDRVMSLDWIGTLPAPELDGATATYREVYDGVDLRVTASTTGYSYVLVVKSAQAAKNAELNRIDLPLRGEGLHLSEGAGGGLTAVDDAGATVFNGAAPSMWDSSTGTQAKGRAAVIIPDDGASETNPGDAPVAGAKTADVDMSVSGGTLSVIPAVSLLRGTGTAYPVYIDPAASITKSEWLYVSQDFPSVKYHKFSGDKGVGFCSHKGEAVCSYDPYMNRMYFKFTPVKSQWTERVVTKVVFRAYETFAFSCTASWVDLSRVDETKVNSNTTWNNKPSDVDLMVDRSVAYGRGASCNPDSDASWVEFSDNSAETNENLTSTVKSRLASGTPVAFSLSAKDETDPNSWKRFRGSDATLSVTYNSRPSKPFNERTVEPASTCVSGSGRPYLPNDNPVLVVNATDPDSENISVRYELTDATANKVVQTGKQGPKAHTASGKPVDYKLPVTATTTHGHTYKWRAISNDGSYDSLSWSDTCEFGVDKERPNKAPTVSSTDFPTDQANKKPGEPGQVFFGANGVADSVFGNDVDYYEWAVGDDNPRNKADAALGGDGQATVTASTFGPNVLYVRSVDRAGNRSDVTRYVFRTIRPCDDPAAESCAAASYLLNEASGTTSADTSGKARTLTVSGVDRVPGQQATQNPADKALRFDGAADYATAASPVDARQGFTVAAWVNPSSLTKDMTIVSQTGAHNSGFALGYSLADKAWVFSRYKHDNAASAATDNVRVLATSINKPEAGKWVQVAGIFDPGRNVLKVYVDGQELGVVEYTGTVWDATAGLQLGRTKANDAWTGAFAGDVDDLRIYPGVLDPLDMDLLWRAARPGN